MRRRAVLFAGAVAAAVLAAIAAGVAVVGPPAEIREIRLDRQKLADLRRIAGAVEVHLNKSGTLPAELKALETPDQPAPFRLADPETGEPYDYAGTGPRSYRLCTTFSHPTGADGKDGDRDRTPGFWHHGAGRHCYAIEVAKPKH